MIVQRLELHDFRNYASTCVQLERGITAVVGDNGQGKTNLAEALAFLATLESFRGAPPEAMVRVGVDQAVIRAEVVHADGRTLTVDAELNRHGRNRVFVNRQRLLRSRDLLGVLRVTVFSPDDLVLVKGGPQGRRDFMDSALTALSVKHDALRRDLERILKQRNTLLKQAGGRLSEEVGFTLDVWDAKLAIVGEQIGAARVALAEDLGPRLVDAYRILSSSDAEVAAIYEPDWRKIGLAAALTAARTDDVRRQQSSVGPHRDDLTIGLNGLPSRTHASQGEQRTLALAMRLAVHQLVAERTEASPVLVLDDVLSELDPGRAAALLDHLPPGQVIITTSSPLPAMARPDRVVRVRAGHVVDDEL